MTESDAGKFVTQNGAIPVDINDHGILWFINASLFHPLGFALMYEAETNQFWLAGDGVERIVFAEDDGPHTADSDRRFNEFHHLLNEAKRIHAERREQQAELSLGKEE